MARVDSASSVIFDVWMSTTYRPEHSIALANYTGPMQSSSWTKSQTTRSGSLRLNSPVDWWSTPVEIMCFTSLWLSLPIDTSMSVSLPLSSSLPSTSLLLSFSIPSTLLVYCVPTLFFQAAYVCILFFHLCFHDPSDMEWITGKGSNEVDIGESQCYYATCVNVYRCMYMVLEPIWVRWSTQQLHISMSSNIVF